MPILDIEVVGDAPDRTGLARRLADAAGEALESRPQGTWVKLRVLSADDYDENGGGGGLQPVFVRLLQHTPPEGDALATQIERLTAAIAAVLQRPAAQVHVLIEPPARGRVSFGGVLQR